MEERISVIIPVHNGQDYIEACVESVAGQTYPELEILVVNDGSTDDTQQICEKLTKRHENLRVFTQPDVGVSAARNYAIEQAKGDYLMFVDADDRICPDVAARLYQVLTETHSDIAGCGFRIWHTEEELRRILQTAQTAGAAENVTRTEYVGSHFLTDSVLQDNCRCWSKLYRRETVGKIRFRADITIGEDMLFLIDMGPHVKKAVEIAYPGYCYYQNPYGAMQRQFTKKHMDQITCWELARDIVVEKDQTLFDRMTAKILVAVMLTVGKIAVLPGDKRRSEREYLAICEKRLKQEMQVSGARAFLSRGYRIKTWVFARMPKGYVFFYHMLHVFRKAR